MGVNLSLANSQANQLRANASQLNSVKSNLTALKSSLSESWKGDEVAKINLAIDRIIAKLQSAANNLNNTANGIVGAANQIRQEEIAAEERRRAEEEARRRVAQAEAERRSAEQRAAREAQMAAEAERKAFDDILEKIKKVKNKTKRNKLLKKAQEPNITAKELEEYFHRIMGK